MRRGLIQFLAFLLLLNGVVPSQHCCMKVRDHSCCDSRATLSAPCCGNLLPAAAVSPELLQRTSTHDSGSGFETLGTLSLPQQNPAGALPMPRASTRPPLALRI